MSRKHRVPTARRSIRLQGKDFAELKDKLVPVSYSMSINGNICVTYMLEDTKKLFHHWLNESEKETFDKDSIPMVDFKTMKGGE